MLRTTIASGGRGGLPEERGGGKPRGGDTEKVMLKAREASRCFKGKSARPQAHHRHYIFSCTSQSPPTYYYMYYTALYFFLVFW